MTWKRPVLTQHMHLPFGGILFLLLAYCFHFNVDLSDEGFYLYYFQQGYKAVSFNFYHVFISPIGNLFSHSLIGYRYLSLFSLAGSSLFLYFSIQAETRKGTWLLPLSLGFMYFNTIATFSYNTLVLCGATLVLSLILRLKTSNIKGIISALIGLLCFLIFSARYGSGLFILILSSLAYFVLIENKWKALKLSIFSSCMFLLSLGIYLFLFKENFFQMQETLRALYESSHASMIGNYLSQSGRFLARSTLPPLSIGLICLRFFPKKTQIALITYLCWFVYHYIVFSFNFTKFWYYGSGFILAVSAMDLRSKYRSSILTKEIALYTLLPLALYFSSSLGTNNNLFNSASYNCLLLYPLISTFRLTNLGIKWLTSAMFFFCGMSIY
jgi:hypothetical protein